MVGLGREGTLVRLGSWRSNHHPLVGEGSSRKQTGAQFSSGRPKVTVPTGHEVHLVRRAEPDRAGPAERSTCADRATLVMPRQRKVTVRGWVQGSSDSASTQPVLQEVADRLPLGRKGQVVGDCLPGRGQLGGRLRPGPGIAVPSPAGRIADLRHPPTIAALVDVAPLGAPAAQ